MNAVQVSTNPQPGILVVEDEALIQILLVEALEEAGYAVVTADSAADALKVLEATEFTAMVTDVRMPGMIDGLELAAIVRSKRPQTRIIVVSGYVEEAERGRTAQTFDRFIRKPYQPQLIIEELQALLG